MINNNLITLFMVKIPDPFIFQLEAIKVLKVILINQT